MLALLNLSGHYKCWYYWTLSSLQKTDISDISFLEKYILQITTASHTKILFKFLFWNNWYEFYFFWTVTPQRNRLFKPNLWVFQLTVFFLKRFWLKIIENFYSKIYNFEDWLEWWLSISADFLRFASKYLRLWLL